MSEISRKLAEKELITNVIELSEHVRKELMKAIRSGEAPAEAFSQIRTMDTDIKYLKEYLKQQMSK